MSKTLVAALLAAAALAAPAVAQAEPTEIWVPTENGLRPGILLSEVPDIDTFPVCRVEDCSDQPGQIGLWFDRDLGDWYLSQGERSLLVIDDLTD